MEPRLSCTQGEAQEWQCHRDSARDEAADALEEARCAGDQTCAARSALDRVTAELQQEHDALLLLKASPYRP